MLNHRKYSSGFINASSRFTSILLILLVIIGSIFSGTIITTLAQGEDPDDAGSRLLDFVMEIASGKLTKTEEHGIREISIFKDGVVL